MAKHGFYCYDHFMGAMVLPRVSLLKFEFSLPAYFPAVQDLDTLTRLTLPHAIINASHYDTYLHCYNTPRRIVLDLDFVSLVSSSLPLASVCLAF
jgi:hypothetical protein